MDTLKITSVALIGADLPNLPTSERGGHNAIKRELAVTLSDGSRVEVWGAWNGYLAQAYAPDCTSAARCAVIQPAAARYTAWLNGGPLPKPSRKYPATN